jgi:tetratricopeptide (TPR) repeat protein
VLEFAPDRLDALNALSWLLATHGGFDASHADEAINLAERACELTGYQQPAVLDTLAAAYAAAGRFNDAVAAAQQALALATSQDQQGLADSIRQRLELYMIGQPYREGPQPATPP